MLTKAARATVRRLTLDLLLPPICLACDESVDAQGQVCADCFRNLVFLGDPSCGCCAQPFAHEGYAAARARDGTLHCAACAAQPPAFARARAALLYAGSGRPLVLRFKHSDRLAHAVPLATMMARAGAELLHDAAVIVPVPLHRRRLRSRRYNQAALLARALGRLAARPVCVDLLRRTRVTAPLGRLGRAMRAEIVQGAFAVRPTRDEVLRGRRVLLVDDVMTTGATLGACSEALLRGGAVAVDVLVAARAGRLDGA